MSSTCSCQSLEIAVISATVEEVKYFALPKFYLVLVPVFIFPNLVVLFPFVNTIFGVSFPIFSNFTKRIFIETMCST